MAHNISHKINDNTNKWHTYIFHRQRRGPKVLIEDIEKKLRVGNFGELDEQILSLMRKTDSNEWRCTICQMTFGNSFHMKEHIEARHL